MRTEMNLKVAVTIILGLCQFGVVLVTGSDAGTHKSFLKAKNFSPPISSGKVVALRYLAYLMLWQNIPDLHEFLYLFEADEGGGELSDNKGGFGNDSGGGNMGKGGGDDDDDDREDDDREDDDREDGIEIWKNIKMEAPDVKKYGGRLYYRSKCGRFWYTKDMVGHGGPYFKKYKDKGSTLELMGSVDISVNLRHMPRIRESALVQTIRKSDMNDTVNR